MNVRVMQCEKVNQSLLDLKLEPMGLGCVYTGRISHQGRRSLEEAHVDLKSGSGESLCAGNPGIWVTRARSRRDISLAQWTSQRQ